MNAISLHVFVACSLTKEIVDLSILIYLLTHNLMALLEDALDFSDSFRGSMSKDEAIVNKKGK